METTRAAALAYAERGWWVIPLWGVKDGRCLCGNPTCESVGKHPCGPLVPHGLTNASKDARVIGGWWDKRPDCNVGVRTGAPSNLAVIDIDPKSGGEYSLETLEAEIDFPATVTACTGSGGTHLLFAYPTDREVTSSAGTLGAGIDTRGRGGYIVAPPSMHASGQRYTWELASGPDDVPLAQLPPKLIERLEQRTLPDVQSGEPITKGMRNLCMFDLGCAMRRKGASEATINSALHAENAARCQPMLPTREVDRIAASAATYEPEDPILRNPDRVKEYWEKGVTAGPLYAFDVDTYLGDSEPPPETDEWWIQGVIPKAVPVVLAGPPKSAKSIAALDMALAIGSGRRWTGSIVTRRARTLTLSLEDSKRTTQRRLWHLMRGYGMQREELQGWMGVDSDLGFNFLSKKAVDALRQTIEKHQIQCVFIDSLSRAGSINENDRKEMSRITVPWQDLCRETGATIVVIHHFRKSSKEADGTETPLGYRLRGSGDLFAFVRHVVGIEAMPKMRWTSKVSTVGNFAELIEPFAIATHAGGEPGAETLKVVHRGTPDELEREELREQVMLAIGMGGMSTSKIAVYLNRGRDTLRPVLYQLESESLIFRKSVKSAWQLTGLT